MVFPRVTQTVMPCLVLPSPYCISPYPVASAPVITTTSRPTAFFRYVSISRRLWRESADALTSAACVAIDLGADGFLLAYFSAARTRDLPHSLGEFLTRSLRSASFAAASPSSMAYMLSWNVLSICTSIESSVSSTVSFTASRSVATA